MGVVPERAEQRGGRIESYSVSREIQLDKSPGLRWRLREIPGRKIMSLLTAAGPK
jgi:hypothetical protein